MVTQRASIPTLDIRRLRTALGISRERMARLMDVSTKTIERWEARGVPPAGRAARSRLAQLQEIVDLGQIVWTPEGFHRFMTIPMPAFGGRSALQLIEAGEGQRVMGELAADYEGLGF
jgi:transcriptional regulator with XRE-family HTH domain